MEKIPRRAAEISAKLMDLRDTMRKLSGERWQQDTHDVRCMLSKMAAELKMPLLHIVLACAKALDKDGRSPLLLLAVGADMIENQEEPDGSTADSADSADRNGRRRT